MNQNKVQALVDFELKHFHGAEVVAAFEELRIPARQVVRRWQYGPPWEHNCWIVAESASNDDILVHCPTGFGPAFPWGLQNKTTPKMGMDDVWYAYLYEAFLSSSLWNGAIPEDFTLMGPGERVASRSPGRDPR